MVILIEFYLVISNILSFPDIHIQASKKKQSGCSDFKYDVAGWFVLGAGIIALFALSRTQVPPPAPR